MDPQIMLDASLPADGVSSLSDLSVLPAASAALWRQAVAGALRSEDPGKLDGVTRDGVTIVALGVPTPSPTGDDARLPLETRPAGRAWRIVQRIDHPDAEAAGLALAEDIAGGVDAVDLVRPDDMAGPAIAAYVARVFEGLDPLPIALHASAGRRTPAVLNAIARLAEARHLPHDALTVHAGIDPVHEVLREASPAFEAVVAAIFDADVPQFNGTKLAFRGQDWHLGGATDGQEIAVALSGTLEVLRAAERLGLDLERVAGAIEFRLVADAGQFTTIAKLRAFRLLLGELLAASGIACGRPAFVHAETSRRMLSKRDPWVNMLRNTIACFGAGIGGADAVTVLAHSIVLGIPDREARRLARNIQTVLLDESRLAVVADPAAGAAGIEALTDNFAGKAWSLMQEIEREGGLLASLHAGGITRRIAQARADRARDIARRRETITGASMYPLIGERLPEVLGQWLDAAPSPLAALLPPARDAEPFEALRDRAEAFEARSGAAPAVFLANLGAVSAFTPRASWIKNLMEAGGIVAKTRPGFEDMTALARAFGMSGAKIAVISSDDATYATHAIAAATALKAAGATHLALAGRPGALETELRSAGVDRFIFDGEDMVDMLAALLRIIEARSR